MKTSKLLKQIKALNARIDKLTRNKSKSKNKGHHQGHGITLELISDILREEREGLTIAQLMQISSAAVGFEMSYIRIYACLRMHKRFFRSSSTPNLWYIDNKI